MKTLTPHDSLTIPLCADTSWLHRDEDLHAVCECGHEMIARTVNLCNVAGMDKMGDRWRQRIRIGLYCARCKKSRIYRVVIAQIHVTDAAHIIKCNTEQQA